MRARTGAAGPAPVLRGLALLLHVPAAMAVLSLPMAAVHGETAGLLAFAVTGAVALVAGQGLYWPCRNAPETQRHHAMLIAALAWLAVSAIGALPFLIAGPPELRQPLNAAFEALSGFTATGLTMAESPGSLPHGLQWWRSFSEWVGGVGVIVLVLSVVPANRGALELFYSEGRDQKILPTVGSTVRTIWILYLGFTVAGIGLLWAAGEPPWVALNHGMTAIATGGFSITDDSLAGETALVKLAYMPILIVGAVSFLVHYRVLRRGELRQLLSGVEQRWFFGMLVGGAALLVLDNAVHAPGIAPLDSLLHWVSALSTAGFQSGDLGAWPAGSVLLMAVAMYSGAMAGSTGGGLKQLRLATLYKSFVWGLAAVARKPHQVLRFMFDGQALNRATAGSRVRAATVLAIAWALLTSIAVLAMVHCVPSGTPVQNVVFEVISAQSNVGLSTGVTGPELSAAGKGVLMLVMWMGRLEIVPVMVLLALALERTATGAR